MRLMVTTLVLACCGLLASATDNPLAGTWKLNAAKSTGPTPPCVRGGILIIPAEIYTGSSSSKPVRQPAGTASESANCTSVYLFTPSADGRTLTMTRPNADPAYKTVFDKGIGARGF
jgi:hypothetical protein